MTGHQWRGLDQPAAVDAATVRVPLAVESSPVVTAEPRFVRVARGADVMPFCAVCPETLRGQQRTYCSVACQMVAYRARKALADYWKVA